MLARRTLAAAAVLIVAMVLSAPNATPQEDFRLTFNANARSMGTSNPPVVPRGGSSVQINITRWSTDEEQEALFTALAESGQGKFFDDLAQQEETGWIRVTGRRGASPGSMPTLRLRYAREYGRDGGRRIVLATNRPVTFHEQLRSPRWRDYDVTFIVLDVDDENRGEGQMAIGVRLEFDEEHNRLSAQSFASEPVRLLNVRAR